MSTQTEALNVLQAANANLGQVIPVVSVHWAEISQERNFKTDIKGGLRTFYHWKPVKDFKSKPSIYNVSDGVQNVYLGEKRWGIRYEGSLAWMIANDMVKCGTGGLAADQGTLLPAVWKSLAEDTPKTPIGEFELPDDWEKRYPLFAAEVAQFRERQRRWCQSNVDAGDALFSEGKMDRIFNDRHRASAIWIGANPDDHKWINQVSQANSKMEKCPFCKVSVEPGANFCGNCRNVIDQASFNAAKKLQTA